LRVAATGPSVCRCSEGDVGIVPLSHQRPDTNRPLAWNL
jgi:hypothetical protein